MGPKAPLWGLARLPNVWVCHQHLDTPYVQEWHQTRCVHRYSRGISCRGISCPGTRSTQILPFLYHTRTGRGPWQMGLPAQKQRGGFWGPFWKAENRKYLIKLRGKNKTRKRKKKTLFFWAARMFVKSLLRLLWCWVSAGCFIKDSWDTLFVH